MKKSTKKVNKKDELTNPKPSKELLESLKEGKKIIQEIKISFGADSVKEDIKKGKRQGYNNVNEMMKNILND